MKDYSRDTDHKGRYIKNGERLFLIQATNGFEGHNVTVDSLTEVIPMIIQSHTNPLNESLLDKKAKFLDSSGDFFHIGNMITDQKDNQEYIAVTEPDSNGIYSTYKIRPLTDDVAFDINGVEFNTKGMLTLGLVYKDGSYVNQENVFEDNTLKALIVQYNVNTSSLNLFENIKVSNNYYKIAEIDNSTLKAYDNYGVLQLVVFRTPQINELKKFDVLNNTKTVINGILKYARVKDKKLNSLSRELLCNYQTVKTGDYIEYSYGVNEQSEILNETYIVYNVPTLYNGYDISLTYRCLSSVKMLNNNGDIIDIPYFFDDNRTRVDKTSDTDYIQDFNSSFMIVVQDNNITSRFVNRQVSRIILKNTAYKISGTSNLDEGLIWLGLTIDDINVSQDVFGVADYYSQLEEIKKNKPDDITVYIDGESSIYKGFTWDYILKNASGISITNWQTDSQYISIIEQDSSHCSIEVKDKYVIGESFVLKAYDTGGNEYSKEIMFE